jgi:hypothetical protein
MREWCELYISLKFIFLVFNYFVFKWRSYIRIKCVITLHNAPNDNEIDVMDH